MTRLQLAHKLGSTSENDGERVYYALYPLDIPHPPSGRIRTTAQCGQCGEPVQCTLYSSRRVPWLRWRRLLIASALFISYALAWYAWAVEFSNMPRGVLITGVWILIAAGVAMCVLAPREYRRFRSEDGARVRDRSRTHSLRAPGDDFEFRVNNFREPGF